MSNTGSLSEKQISLLRSIAAYGPKAVNGTAPATWKSLVRRGLIGHDFNLTDAGRAAMK